MLRKTYLFAIALTLGLFARVSVAWGEYRGSDPFDNVMPSPFITSPNADKYPIGAYDLDYHVDVSLTSDKSWFAGAAQWLVAQAWDILSHIGMLLIDAVAWAFDVNFITGPNGMLPAVHEAMLYLHENVVDQRYVGIAIGLLGVWGGFKALSSPTEVLSKFATSFFCTLVVLALIYQPTGIYKTGVEMVNDVSSGVMSTLTPGQEADDGQRAARDHLHQMIIQRPWAVLEFGGLQHCVDTGDLDEDGYPKNVNKFARTKGEKVCRDHMERKGGYGGYADRFLSQAPGSEARAREYTALKDGKVPEAEGPNPISDCPRGDCSGAQSKIDEEKAIQQQFGDGYKVDKADAPAVDIMQQGGSGHRLTLAAIIIIGLIGILLLLARMVGVMLASEIASLALLAFAPIILLFGIVPAGHGVFKWWLKSLGLAMFIKLIVATILVVLLVVSMAFTAIAIKLDFMLVWAVQAGFYWLLYKKRSQIMSAFGGVAAQQMSKRGLSVAGIYAASRPYRALSRSFKRTGKKVMPGGGGKKGGGSRGGRSEDPEDQETAVGSSTSSAHVDRSGEGSASVHSDDVRSSRPTPDGDAPASDTNGHVRGPSGAPTPGEAPGTGGDSPVGSPRLVAASETTNGNGKHTDPVPPDRKKSKDDMMAEWHKERARERDEETYRWATIDMPAESQDAGKLHKDALWRLDRFRAERDAFGRELQKPPVMPPPPPKDI